MQNLSLEQLLETAIFAAKKAGAHALENEHRRTETAETFTHDVKLVLDAECQEIAEQAILKTFPNHAILGEEGITEVDSEYEWIIDPIDGTMNFTRGFPYWCVSIAVRKNGTVLAGCVFNPVSNECFTAHIKSKAYCNGNLIQPAQTDKLEESTLFSGISKYVNQNPAPHFKLFQTLIFNTRKVRINGSAALDICHVAAGHADGYFETTLYLWDHAAAGLIAKQAGAVIHTYPLPHAPHACGVICTNKQLIKPLLSIHADCFTT
jgi:myo-inositol-1(or 4)-monophosphatase